MKYRIGNMRRARSWAASLLAALMILAMLPGSVSAMGPDAGDGGSALPAADSEPDSGAAMSYDGHGTATFAMRSGASASDRVEVWVKMVWVGGMGYNAAYAITVQLLRDGEPYDPSPDDGDQGLVYVDDTSWKYGWSHG